MVQVREDYKIVRKLREEWKRVTGKVDKGGQRGLRGRARDGRVPDSFPDSRSEGEETLSASNVPGTLQSFCLTVGRACTVSNFKVFHV